MMKITDTPSSLFAGDSDLSATPSHQPSITDANLFSNSVADEPADAIPQGGILNHATQMFDQVNDQKNRIDNSLRRASKSTDPTVMNKVEGQLSDYYLENMMNTKIVSKAVQSVDKITNLQ